MGVMRLDGARGTKQFAAPMFELEVFRKQMYCIEESNSDNVGTFVAPAVIQRSHSDSAPEEFCPLAPPRYTPEYIDSKSREVSLAPHSYLSLFPLGR